MTPVGSRDTSTVIAVDAMSRSAEASSVASGDIDALRFLRRRKVLVLPLAILAAFVGVGALAPYLAPQSPTATDLGLQLTPPAGLADGVAGRPTRSDLTRT